MTQRTAPSAAELIEKLGMTAEEARQARKAMHAGKLAEVKASGFFGVERIRDDKNRLVLIYLNAGDAYAPTIVRRAGSSRYRISTWGDEIEALARSGVAIN